MSLNVVETDLAILHERGISDQNLRSTLGVWDVRGHNAMRRDRMPDGAVDDDTRQYNATMKHRNTTPCSDVMAIMIGNDHSQQDNKQ